MEDVLAFYCEINDLTKPEYSPQIIFSPEFSFKVSCKFLNKTYSLPQEFNCIITAKYHLAKYVLFSIMTEYCKENPGFTLLDEFNYLMEMYYSIRLNDQRYFIQACDEGNLYIIKLFINDNDANRDYAMKKAVMKNYVHVVEYILKNGGRPTRFAVRYAFRKGYFEIIKLFVPYFFQCRSCVNIKNNFCIHKKEIVFTESLLKYSKNIIIFIIILQNYYQLFYYESNFNILALSSFHFRIFRNASSGVTSVTRYPKSYFLFGFNL